MAFTDAERYAAIQAASDLRDIFPLIESSLREAGEASRLKDARRYLAHARHGVAELQRLMVPLFDANATRLATEVVTHAC
jgi:hypothetical protein